MATIPKLITSGKNRREFVERNTKRCEEVYIKGDKVSEYPDFKNSLCNVYVSKPNRDTEFASQGLCHIGDYTLITSYDPTDRDFIKSLGATIIGAEDANFKTKNSIIDIVGPNGETKTLVLDNKSHVGGIAFHEESGKVFVSNDSKVNVYDINTIANAKDGDTIKPESSFDFKKLSGGNASYLQVHNNNLYVGIFSKESGASLYRYDLDSEGNESNPEKFKVPYSKVQGLEILENDGKEYFIFSTSYGRTNSSQLSFSELTDSGKFEPVTYMKVPCMSEQISFNKNGQLGIVFESDSTYYANASKEIGNVLYIDAEEYLKENINDWAEEKEKLGKFLEILDIDD